MGDPAHAQAPFEVAEAGDSVRITRRLENNPVNADHGSAMGNLGHRVNRTSES